MDVLNYLKSVEDKLNNNVVIVVAKMGIVSGMELNVLKNNVILLMKHSIQSLNANHGRILVQPPLDTVWVVCLSNQLV